MSIPSPFPSPAPSLPVTHAKPTRGPTRARNLPANGPATWVQGGCARRPIPMNGTCFTASRTLKPCRPGRNPKSADGGSKAPPSSWGSHGWSAVPGSRDGFPNPATSRRPGDRIAAAVEAGRQHLPAVLSLEPAGQFPAAPLGSGLAPWWVLRGRFPTAWPLRTWPMSTSMNLREVKRWARCLFDTSSKVRKA